MAKKRNYYNDWVLPVATTFLGVFAAAYLTIWYEDRNEDESVRMLLEVAQTDSCLALSSVQNAVERFAAEPGQPINASILEPKIMLAVLEDNAKSMADFHNGLTAEMVGLLATIENDIVKYRHELEQLQRFARIVPFISIDEGDGRAILDSEQQRMLANIVAMAGDIERSLKRMVFLLDQQLDLIHGNLSSRQVSNNLAAADFTVKCKTAN